MRKTLFCMGEAVVTHVEEIWILRYEVISRAAVRVTLPWEGLPAERTSTLVDSLPESICGTSPRLMEELT